jgi:DNA processing protein
LIAPQGGNNKLFGIPLTHQQRHDWLRLIRSENVGPATFRDLINYAGSAANALQMLPELSQKAGLRRSIKLCSVAEATAELAAVDALGAKIIGLGEPEYPPLLRQIDSPPPMVTIRGSFDVFARQAIAIVGSRNASVAGRKIASQLSADLAARGIVIISGLARGIDAAAHSAAKAQGSVAAMAGGLDRIYPEQNIQLAEDLIAGGGAHITEMPLGWQPRARDFPRRNRLISGLSCGVLVVEAAERSGSLITARLAGEQGRDVFAVPNSPLDPRGAGTNRLLKQGAVVVTAVADILETITAQDTLINQPPVDWREDEGDRIPRPPIDSMRQRIIDCLGPTPIQIDDIIRYSGCTPSEVYYVLMELSLAGKLERHRHNLVSISDLNAAGGN